MAKKKTLSNPDSAEREYTRLLTRFVRELRADANAALIPAVPGIVDQFNQEIRADSWTDAIALVMAELLSAATIKTTRIIDRLPGMYALINRHNERQFGMVVRANTGLTVPEARLLNGPGALNSMAPVRNALGVNIFRGEPYLAPLYEGWIAENTKLVRSIPEQYHSGLDDTLRRGIMGGDSPRDLARKIRDRFGVTERRARLIATDQTLSAHAELTRYRAQSVGVKQYTWETVNDNRVRPEHAEREGKVFSWDKPPPDGHPGQPIRCRCSAGLIFPDDDE